MLRCSVWVLEMRWPWQAREGEGAYLALPSRAPRPSTVYCTDIQPVHTVQNTDVIDHLQYCTGRAPRHSTSLLLAAGTEQRHSPQTNRPTVQNSARALLLDAVLVLYGTVRCRTSRILSLAPSASSASRLALVASQAELSAEWQFIAQHIYATTIQYSTYGFSGTGGRSVDRSGLSHQRHAGDWSLTWLSFATYRPWAIQVSIREIKRCANITIFITHHMESVVSSLNHHVVRPMLRPACSAPQASSCSSCTPAYCSEGPRSR